MNIDLTVIIPCYNEVRRLGGFFDLIRSHPDLEWEWLFIDDGSTDETAAVIRAFSESVPQKVRLVSLPENMGKGRAVCEGIMNARAPLVGYIDADLSASPLLFAGLINDPDLLAGREMIVGIRKNSRESPIKRHLYRHILGRFFRLYTSALTGLYVYDSQCGFKLLASSRARDIASAMTIEGFSFDVELLLRALHSGMRLKEVPVPWEEKRDNKIRLYHLFEMARDVHRIWWRLNVLRNY